MPRPNLPFNVHVFVLLWVVIVTHRIVYSLCAYYVVDINWKTCDSAGTSRLIRSFKHVHSVLYSKDRFTVLALQWCFDSSSLDYL